MFSSASFIHLEGDLVSSLIINPVNTYAFPIATKNYRFKIKEPDNLQTGKCLSRTHSFGVFLCLSQY